MPCRPSVVDEVGTALKYSYMVSEDLDACRGMSISSITTCLHFLARITSPKPTSRLRRRIVEQLPWAMRCRCLFCCANGLILYCSLFLLRPHYLMRVLYILILDIYISIPSFKILTTYHSRRFEAILCFHEMHNSW